MNVSRGDLIRAGLLLSALPFMGALSPAEELNINITPRKRELFDFNWKFHLGNGCDPSKDFAFGADQGDFAKTGEFEIATKKFDDTAWRDLDLPHDWAVELPFVHDDATKSHGYKPLGRRYPDTSVGWYRRRFHIPASDASKRIAIEFDGAFRDVLVFLNGSFIGRNNNGYVPFSFDLTDFLNYGNEENYLAVRVDASFGDGWFYEGAGLYRHVWLHTYERLHLVPLESVVRAELRNARADLTLLAAVANETHAAGTASVRWEIRDAAGSVVANATSSEQTIDPGGTAAFSATASLSDPALWSPESPSLYTAVVSVESSGRRDAEAVRFGVRSIDFDVDRGFFLNGQPVKIKGTCNHQDHAGVGAALPDRLQYYRVEVLKAMGSNGMRTSHNMPTPELIEACDRLGMMVMCETRQMSSTPEALAQLTAMIKRYRNAPSVVIWSMGNEEWELQSEPAGERVMETMVSHVHSLDPTRLCTAAVNGDYGKGISKALDVEGFNYNLKDIDDYHRSHPHQAGIGSETASSLATRGIYSTDKSLRQLSAYDVNATDWGQTAEQWWSFYAARDWLAGGFAWTGFDYRGEPTPYDWPSISSQFGIVDTCGFPKDTYYYYRAWWGNEPVLHLFPHWNWAGMEGEMISVWAHSNLDAVELFINGASAGVQHVTPLSHVEWKVPYAPGAIEARGMKNGAVVLTQTCETVGAPVALKLTADRSKIDADGEDIAIVRVEALDAHGRHVPTADLRVTFALSGNGRLIGLGNGDPNCLESDKGNERSLFSGLAQAIVQASKSPGAIVLQATAPGVSAASLSIATAGGPGRPSVA